ncbi:MAG: hypothetical protein K2I42_02345, partial [Anaeroplasmataceae bacterium]|nr:hypothetical protein [Anaeroplasmataceae bacterium]
MKKIMLIILMVFTLSFTPTFFLENESKDIIYKESVSFLNSNDYTESSQNFIPTNNNTIYSMKQYFMNLNENIGYNVAGTCGLVAIGMLLSYYDTFWNDCIIPEYYDQNVNLSYLTTNIVCDTSPGIISEKQLFLNDYEQKVKQYGTYTNADYFNFIEENSWKYYHLNLLELAIGTSNINIYSSSALSFGMTYSQIYSFLYSYLKGTNINVVIQNNLDKNKSAKSYAIEKIKQGVPVLMGISDNQGNGHVVVAYDYDEDDMIYFNPGLDTYGTYSSLSYMSYSAYDFAVSIEVLGDNHICSDNYLFDQESYCVCDYFSIYPTHSHKYRLYEKNNLINHYELCLCNARRKGSHSINTKNYYRKNGKLFSTCLQCNQELEINLDGPI